MPKGHYCDKCESELEEEDYDEIGSWSYRCPECGFRYVHGVTVLDDDFDDEYPDEYAEMEEIEENE